LTSSRGMMLNPKAFGTFSWPHSGSISNGVFQSSSSLGYELMWLQIRSTSSCVRSSNDVPYGRTLLNRVWAFSM
jgi:hypothetical protein